MHKLHALFPFIQCVVGEIYRLTLHAKKRCAMLLSNHLLLRFITIIYVIGKIFRRCKIEISLPTRSSGADEF